MTFSFEMRSGREHNTPDKAMWGFLVTVRAQVVYTFRLNFVFDIHYQIYGLEELIATVFAPSPNNDRVI